MRERERERVVKEISGIMPGERMMIGFSLHEMGKWRQRAVGV
jgi:hypothetical protein